MCTTSFFCYCTINRKIIGTPKGLYLPISKLHCLIVTVMIMLLCASKFATSTIECSFEIGKYTPFGGYHLFCCWWNIGNTVNGRVMANLLSLSGSPAVHSKTNVLTLSKKKMKWKKWAKWGTDAIKCAPCKIGLSGSSMQKQELAKYFIGCS